MILIPPQVLSRALSATAWGLPLLMLPFALGCERTFRPLAMASEPEALTRVKVVRPVRKEIIRKISLTGSIRADLEVTLHGKIAGFLKSISKDRGDRVAAGELIATLEIPELALEIESARASFALEDATLHRLEAVRKTERTAVTDQDLELARAKRAIAEASLKRFQALLGYAEIRAPFDGYVTERFVDPGALVREGRIVSIVDASKVRVIVDVPEPEVRFVTLGTTARVLLDALPGIALPAQVARMEKALDPATRTMRVELDLANPDRKVLPGMFSRVEIDIERRPDAVVIPAGAVITHQERSFVFVASGGKAKKLDVALGTRDGDFYEATSGLAGEESVILPEGRTLSDGTPVAPEAPAAPRANG